MDINYLTRLYPHLNLKRQNPTPLPIRSRSCSVSRPSVRFFETPKFTESPKIIETPISEPIKNDEPPIVAITNNTGESQKIGIEEKINRRSYSPANVNLQTIKNEMSKNIETKVKECKPLDPSKPKPKPKGRPRIRPQHVPKMDLETRKQHYINRLARTSVKKADEECEKIKELVDNVENDPDKLKEVEKETRKKLKLINTAKFFMDFPDIKKEYDKQVSANTDWKTSVAN